MSAPARAYKATGVVLRARNLGEADRIVTLFTAEHGKRDAVAKGVRRQKSHLGGRFEFANEVCLTMHRGRNLDVIVSAEIVREHWRFIVEPPAFAAASAIAEMVDGFCEPDLPVPAVYALLTGALGAVAGRDDPLAVLPRFSLLLLDALGLAPPLEACVRCGAVLKRGAWLDAEQGGLAGPECREAWREALELTPGEIENMRALASWRGSRDRSALRAAPRVAKAIESLVSHHLGRRLKAGLYAAEFVTAPG